ncbi:hypothetical protein HX855_05940 [Pseudomonas sp. IPO3778]|nr:MULTISPECIES: hypothetical protein [unclassified Pseudomonas]NWC94072.1 hypothetical protein [Pseudomonas sp. IPO3779]NWD16332.1 hypothetical protein [Pseudomonas sp. IPO3778]
MLLALCCGLTTGCVGFYQQPAPTAPHATLEAIQGANTLLNGGVQMYWAYYDPGCNDTAETGVLGTRKGEASERFLLIPDRRIYVNVMSGGAANKEGANYPRYCANVASFVPAVGATYQIVQAVPVIGCVVEITDKSTGRAPESFRKEAVVGGCSP